MNDTKLFNPVNNGRIDLITKTQGPDISNLFSMYDKIPANQCTTFRDATVGQWEETPLSLAYFSQQNIQIIQNGIRAGVYRKSNEQYVIAPVNCDVLKVVMRSVFMQHAANKPTNIPKQIAELNQMVLDYCIFNAYSEAQGYLKYLQDVSTLPAPLSTPVVERQKDKNNYNMPSWF